MIEKKKIAVLFGGCSPEHQVSIRSAKRVSEAINEAGYICVLVYINRETGIWNLVPNFDELTDHRPVTLVPGQTGRLFAEKREDDVVIEAIFPVLHGPYGEDGTVQGIISLSRTPYVGCGVTSSAICMDKEITKKLLSQAGLSTGKFLSFYRKPTFQQVESELKLPFFVKPCRMGSSIGISKVTSESEFQTAIDLAFKYDNKIIIEEYIEGREIECALLGDEASAEASPLGEIVPHYDFYTYEAKYSTRSSSDLIIPAALSPEKKAEIQSVAKKVFEVLGCYGLARVDFFVSEEKITVGEVNTLPGFTSISMYPRLWQEGGLSFANLVERLIFLAIERYNKTI